MTDITPELFEEAATKIDNAPELARGRFLAVGKDDEVTYCTLGAVVYSQEGDKILKCSIENEEFASLILEANPDISVHPIPETGLSHKIFSWNDDPIRTKSDVYNALMNTAKMLRNQGV